MERPNLRAVFIGPENVGKTCLIRHVSTDEFFGEGLTLPSIGAEFTCAEIQAADGHRVTIGLWDTPGQTTYRDLILPPLRNADFVVLVFDLTSRRTFAKLRRYFDKAKLATPPRAQFILLGNKSDLDADRAVTIDEIRDYAADINSAGSLEASAKTGDGIPVLRLMLTDAALADRDRVDSVLLGADEPKQGGCGC
jgi:small GTP-binding protein